MTDEHIQQLIQSYPHLFPDSCAEVISVGDGWYHLIDVFCAKLMKYLYDMSGEALPEVYIVQVKEKFGVLRIYTEGYWDYNTTQLAIDAERESADICERCSEAGTLYERRKWLKTLCEEHAGVEYTKINRNGETGYISILSTYNGLLKKK